MQDLQKKILLDLFVCPGTVLPITAGVSLLLLSTIIGPSCGFLGFCLVLFGIGIGTTNYLFNYDKKLKQVIEKINNNKQKERNEKLDELDVKLSSDRDPRDQEALRNLRSLYDVFMEDVRTGKISIAASNSMCLQIEDIFNQCIKQLEKQHELWLTSRKVSGSIKEELMNQKSSIMDDVESSVKNLVEVINEVRSLGLKVQKNELGRLQERLRIQLDAAKETEKVVEQANGDLTRFAEYEKK